MSEQPEPSGTPGRPVAGPSQTAFAQALGGRRGVLDAGLPTLVFVVAFTLTSTRPAALAALASGVLVVGVRLARREPVRQAVSGLLGLAVAVVLAVWTRGGDGTGFFLYGIGVNTVYAAVFAGSVVVRRPLVGVLVAALSGDRGWHDDPGRLRAFAVVTLGWTALFVLRAGLQAGLLSQGVAVVGVVRLVMGLPLTVAALAASWWYLTHRGALSADSAAALRAQRGASRRRPRDGESSDGHDGAGGSRP